MARPRRLVGGVAPAFLAVASALQPALRVRTPALASCRSRPAVARADAVSALRAGGGGDDTTAAARGYDCAVIGAGPAGSVVAWLLAEREAELDGLYALLTQPLPALPTRAEREEALGEADESLSEGSEIGVEDLARVNRALMSDRLLSDSD